MYAVTAFGVDTVLKECNNWSLYLRGTLRHSSLGCKLRVVKLIQGLKRKAKLSTAARKVPREHWTLPAFEVGYKIGPDKKQQTFFTRLAA